MDEAQAKRILEALLFVFSHPLPLKRLTEVLPDLDATQIRRLLSQLNEEYVSANRAFTVREVAGGYLITTDETLAPWVQRALASPKPDSVSNASLETLAIIAYRQPITKAEIEAIRGVDVSGALETLLERRFVRIAGRRETPGRPNLYGTTHEFLRHFGLHSLDALPRPAGLVDIQEPTGEPAPVAQEPAVEPQQALGAVADQSSGSQPG